MFYEQLKQATEVDRQRLVNSEIIQRCMARNVTLNEYIDYLTQAYHHVKFTVPLLMAVGANLPEKYECESKTSNIPVDLNGTKKIKWNKFKESGFTSVKLA